ncbi:hypothetical protein QWY28_17855 [Nocardioides sp. SOB77]|uniref:Uncharacterized protein n=1 Tax=Nocardioides oceani TaxID=3058369 RepID=A0ABT8FJH2_9ACTN|nr:hypothetical protein [Nocardioides oceani]MDN4174832.1 hypothetical protein [Nocardioides oceani]
MTRREPQDRTDYTRLPAPTPIEDTVVSVDAAPLPDPHAGRNVDQHLALRED